MAHPILMPRPGQMTEMCVLTAWRKAEGDPVARGDVLFEIETDKAAMEVEAFVEGVLLRQVVAAGTEVPVNAVCAWVGEPGEAIPEALPDVAPAEVSVVGLTPASSPVGGPSPAVAPSTAPASEVSVSAGSAGPSLSRARGGVRISPRAMRLAVEAGLDPRLVAGTGPGGRIVERDVRAALTTRAAPRPAASAAVEGEGSPEPLSRMRRVIAERLTLSVTTIPTFTVTAGVDITGLLALRRELREAGRDLSVTDFVLAATAQALAEHPSVNARTDGVSVWPRSRVHLGVAVSVPDGLLVPVIRDADRMSVDGIHAAAERLVMAARRGELGPDELAGSTFTVSNLGMHGVDEFSAIINPGESGILAVGRAAETPVALDGGLAVRWVMKLTLTADHRLVDGELGARFLNAIRRRLEDYRGWRRELPPA